MVSATFLLANPGPCAMSHSLSPSEDMLVRPSWLQNFLLAVLLRQIPFIKNIGAALTFAREGYHLKCFLIKMVGKSLGLAYISLSAMALA